MKIRLDADIDSDETVWERFDYRGDEAFNYNYSSFGGCQVMITHNRGTEIFHTLQRALSGDLGNNEPEKWAGGTVGWSIRQSIINAWYQLEGWELYFKDEVPRMIPVEGEGNIICSAHMLTPGMCFLGRWENGKGIDEDMILVQNGSNLECHTLGIIKEVYKASEVGVIEKHGIGIVP